MLIIKISWGRLTVSARNEFQSKCVKSSFTSSVRSPRRKTERGRSFTKTVRLVRKLTNSRRTTTPTRLAVIQPRQCTSRPWRTKGEKKSGGTRSISGDKKLTKSTLTESSCLRKVKRSTRDVKEIKVWRALQVLWIIIRVWLQHNLKTNLREALEIQTPNQEEVQEVEK